MAKKVNIVGTRPKRVRVVDEPRRRVEPANLAAALGAEPGGHRVGANLDSISLGELGTELLRRLRSSGGRPALADATEYCRVPLSTEDVKALEKITGEIEQRTGAKPSPGQVVSIIVREYLGVGPATSQEPRVVTTINDQVNEHINAIAAWLPRLAEIVNRATTVQKSSDAIETSAKEIKEDVDRRVAEVLRLLRRDVE